MDLPELLWHAQKVQLVLGSSPPLLRGLPGELFRKDGQLTIGLKSRNTSAASPAPRSNSLESMAHFPGEPRGELLPKDGPRLLGKFRKYTSCFHSRKRSKSSWRARISLDNCLENRSRRMATDSWVTSSSTSAASTRAVASGVTAAAEPDAATPRVRCFAPATKPWLFARPVLHSCAFNCPFFYGLGLTRSEICTQLTRADGGTLLHPFQAHSRPPLWENLFPKLFWPSRPWPRGAAPPGHAPLCLGGEGEVGGTKRIEE